MKIEKKDFAVIIFNKNLCFARYVKTEQIQSVENCASMLFVKLLSKALSLAIIVPRLNYILSLLSYKGTCIVYLIFVFFALRIVEEIDAYFVNWNG